MICLTCKRVFSCSLGQSAIDCGATITNCKTFIAQERYRHLNIAKNEELLCLIYDYFLENIDEEIVAEHNGYHGVKNFIADYLRNNL